MRPKPPELVPPNASFFCDPEYHLTVLVETTYPGTSEPKKEVLFEQVFREGEQALLVTSVPVQGQHIGRNIDVCSLTPFEHATTHVMDICDALKERVDNTGLLRCHSLERKVLSDKERNCDG